MDELDVFTSLKEASAITQYGDLFGEDTEKAKQIAAHKAWLQIIRRERPSPGFPYKVGVYIRYYSFDPVVCEKPGLFIQLLQALEIFAHKK